MSLLLLALTACIDDGKAGPDPGDGCVAVTETCNGIDDDCDGAVDNDAVDAPARYVDEDGDGFGGASVVACEATEGMVDEGDDCDDADPSAWPGAPEVCGDGVANDCGGGGDPTACLLGGSRAASGADASFVAEAPGDGAGCAVAGVGDADGDGLDDLAIGAYAHESGGASEGIAYVAYSPFAGSSSLATADAWLLPQGVTHLGEALAPAGDLDGDGLADTLAGASFESGGGEAYVIPGGRSGEVARDALLLTLEADTTNDRAGGAVAGVGDALGDAAPDFVIGAPWSGKDSVTSPRGATYLVAGRTGTLELSGANAILLGEGEGDESGSAVAGVGDADGDGIADFLVGAPHQDADADEAGAVYLVSTAITGQGYVDDVATARFAGAGYDLAGWSVAGPGDVDGDGLGDLLIGAPTFYGGGRKALGAAFVVAGGPPTSGSLARTWARFEGAGVSDYVGQAVAGPGDVDGDGKGDFLVGAPYLDGPAGIDAGAAFVFLGGVPGVTSVADAAVRFDGPAEDSLFGSAVAGAGDVNGDGLIDVIVGAYGTVEGGGAWLFLGAAGI